jgi:hypothetical protein
VDAHKCRSEAILACSLRVGMVSRPVGGTLAPALSTGVRHGPMCAVTCGFSPCVVPRNVRQSPLLRCLPRPGRGLDTGDARCCLVAGSLSRGRGLPDRGADIRMAVPHPGELPARRTSHSSDPRLRRSVRRRAPSGVEHVLAVARLRPTRPSATGQIEVRRRSARTRSGTSWLADQTSDRLIEPGPA